MIGQSTKGGELFLEKVYYFILREKKEKKDNKIVVQKVAF